MKSETKELIAASRELIRRLLGFIPSQESIDWSQTYAARWRRGIGSEFIALSELDGIDLDDLLEIEKQKQQIDLNTAQFVGGYPANNALLWGARGTGKSSLIHALLNRYSEFGLRLVEVDKNALADISEIGMKLRDEPYRFVIVCDDLSFEADDPSFKELKSALEGSVFGQSENVLIYATSNRRHLIPEYMSDNLAAAHNQGELHDGEAIEEKISLSDRFGLWLSFYPFNQDQYLTVVRYWLERLALMHEVEFVWTDEVRQSSLQWALGRGVRSGRTAYYYSRHWIGKTLLEKSKTN